MGGELSHPYSLPTAFQNDFPEVKSQYSMPCPCCLIKSIRGRSRFLNWETGKGLEPPGRGSLLSSHPTPNKTRSFLSFLSSMTKAVYWPDTLLSLLIFFLSYKWCSYLFSLDFWFHKYYDSFNIYLFLFQNMENWKSHFSCFCRTCYNEVELQKIPLCVCIAQKRFHEYFLIIAIL